MTTSAGQNTSTSEKRHADRTHDGEAHWHASSRNGGGAENTAARPGRGRVELSGTPRDAGRPAMELAREPGAGPAHESGQTSRQGLYRGDRLPRGAGARQKRHSSAGARI